MADKRMLSSNIWQDEFFGELSLLDRLLWIGLFSVADDQGRCPLAPPILRSKIFPWDETITAAQILDGIRIFEQAGKIVIYQDDKGRQILQLVNWWRHQNLQWPQPSSLPAPDGWTDRVRYHISRAKVVTLNWDKPGGFTTQSVRQSACSYPDTHPDSHPDSVPPYPIEGVVEGEGAEAVEGEGDEDDARRNLPPIPASPSSSSEISLSANYVPKNAAEAIKHPAVMVYRTVTGLTPARKDYEEIISAVVVCQVKNSLDPGFDLVEHLRAYFDAYKARRTKAGALYDPRGLAWLTEWAASGQIPPDRRNGKTPQDYALPEDQADPTPTDPAEWQPDPPPDLKTRAGQLAAALEQLRAEIPPGNHKHFKGARLLAVEGDVWTIQVPAAGVAWCQDRLAKFLQRFLHGYANQPNLTVIFQEPP